MKVKSLLKALVFFSAFAFLCGLSAEARSDIVWGSIINVTGASPACNLSGVSVCFDLMSANSAPTFSNIGTSGSNFALVWHQDGTGSRTLTLPTSAPTVVMPGGTAASPGTLPAIPSAANAYTVWLVQSNGTNLVLQGSYDNTTGITGAGTAPAPNNQGSQASAVTCNWKLASTCAFTATGNVTVTFVAPAAAGGKYSLVATQDATGGRSITLPATVKAANGSTVPTDLFAQQANAVSAMTMYFDGTNFDITSAPNAINACAGQQALTSGTPSTATVTNKCFTGSTNVVLCTDATSAGAIKCVGAAGSLSITGPNTVTDTINWARVQ